MPGGGYAPPEHDLDPRLARPRSGLFAQIRSIKHQWRSPSTAGPRSISGRCWARGIEAIRTAEFGHDRVAIESRGLQFEDERAKHAVVTFSVAVSLTPYEDQLWRFRQKMLGSFSGLMLLLLLTLAALLRWVLEPVAPARARDSRGRGRGVARSSATDIRAS